jgi:hypothetical protein
LTSELLLAKSEKAIEFMIPTSEPHGRRQLTRVNSTNVLDEGLRIGEISNSKVKISQTRCVLKIGISIFVPSGP